MSRFNVVLLIHAHQPVGNFDDVIRRAYGMSYLPFVQTLEKHPGVRLGLHYSGGLLEWIAEHQPEYFDLLTVLVQRGQVEMIGGGFYEPILIAIPREDAKEQIERLADYLHRRFGQRPRGAWLAERVWEPQLPSVLSSASVEYTLVDDNHFLSAGFDPNGLFGTFVAEDQGRSVRLLPGLKALRYLIPYKSPEEVVGFFRNAAQLRPGGIAAMGDDMEKFGIWPGTYDHCYKNGWLENFFHALETNQDWLATIPPGEAVSKYAAIGRADLPTCSYAEMMEWALPTQARLTLRAVEKEFAAREDVTRFLRGGFWRAFLTKYPESNLMQKRAMLVSQKLRCLNGNRPPCDTNRLHEAQTDLLRAQANDAYWHGVFGGVYAPHLRTAVWKPLIRAEAFADQASRNGQRFTDVHRGDVNQDGHDEVYVTTNNAGVLFAPDDGGTVAAMDYRPADVALINSMMRRPEAYHARLSEASSGGSSVSSIHDQVRAKEPGLEKKLKYDRWPRHSFRLLVFSEARTHMDYENLRLEENAALAGGAFQIRAANPLAVRLASETEEWSAEKAFTFSAPGSEFQVACDLALEYRGNAPLKANVGIEMIVNFLAPDAPDRYFETSGERHSLQWSGAASGAELKVVDVWQNVSIHLFAPLAREFWIAPIETISESEEGFECVYQGSQIMALWPAEFQPHTLWKARLILRAEMYSAEPPRTGLNRETQVAP